MDGKYEWAREVRVISVAKPMLTRNRVNPDYVRHYPRNMNPGHKLASVSLLSPLPDYFLVFFPPQKISRKSFALAHLSYINLIKFLGRRTSLKEPSVLFLYSEELGYETIE